ncbi:MAG: hypothetical protein ACI9MC_001884 [Kiritimatiellia bacterium]|jgi:hypothetical protein
MRSFLITAALIAMAATSVGCGEDTRSCQSACSRAFKSSECGIPVPGEESGSLIKDCIRECETALRLTGELGNYDPDDRNSVDRSTRYQLQNEKQSAVWMDCVMETSCEALEDGYCPGGGIN